MADRGAVAATASGERAVPAATPDAAGASKRQRCGGAAVEAEGSAHKKARSRCPHQRIRSQCKECGGASICQHQRRRSECKECREDADESMPDGLEELGEGTYRAAAGPGEQHAPS